jgi:4-hydroxyphenylpyruvate dioxygenase
MELSKRDIDNPLGLNGFEFVEFTGPDCVAMGEYLKKLGFTATSKHPTKDIIRFTQGGITFLLNNEPLGHAAQFRKVHGPSASSMAFRASKPATAYKEALLRGAKPAHSALRSLGEGHYVLDGIGGSHLYLVADEANEPSLYADWHDLPDAAPQNKSINLQILDHLTHNVKRGNMRQWSDFYSRIFGFEEQKYFDIKGQATGLFSQAMIAPDKAIRIPLNESQDDKSQIEEFLRQYNGEGIQHIALTTPDIYATVEALRARGVKLQDTPDTYYELIDKRIPNHGEDIKRLKANRILIDGDTNTEGLLLQIFTEPVFGPIFFEIIQRKGNEGFGNGNFQALFESIELDQFRRGVI